MTQIYQLTKFPVGSKREFWAMSWPLMLAMLSATLMMFVDRIFLARYSAAGLNASATGGMAYYVFMMLPMSIASISEVLVGRLHGERRHAEVGQAVWQMVWFSCLLAPVFFLIAYLIPQFVFYGSGIESYETAYFRPLLYFAPFQCAGIALAGFFIGVGKVQVVTVSAILSNLVNIFLGYVLIFGWGVIPSYGIVGAAYATGLAQFSQVIFLLFMLLKRAERNVYRTDQLSFHRHFFVEGLRIGAPSGLGHTLEFMAHFLFFRVVMSVDQAQATIVVMVQSFYILCSFVNEAGSKAAGAIVANLLGAKVKKPLHLVLVSSFALQWLYFLLFAGIVLFFPDALIDLFLSQSGHLLLDPQMKHTFVWALFFMTLFFLFDGFSWLMIGFLTAAGDTRFIFWVSLVVHWGLYVIPTVLFIGIQKRGAAAAWAIVACMSLLTALIYFHRYITGKWLKKYHRI